MPTKTIDRETIAVIIPAGTTNVESARSLARRRAAGRAAGRAADRVAATSRGWSILTADNVADMLRAGESIGREYLGSDAAEIATAGLDRVARWLGDLPAESDAIARLATSRGSSGYAARLARLAARQYASKHGTGRGSMPRLVLSDDEIDARLTAVYGIRSHAVAVAAARNVTRELDDMELGPRVAAALWHAELAATPTTYRASTDAEIDAIRRASKYERTAAAPMFSRWLDAYGDSVPTAGNAHTFAHIAPGVPTRDAGPLRRGSMAQRLAAVGIDRDTIDAATMALDAANTRAISDDGMRVGKYPRRVYWSRIAAALEIDAVPATLGRRVTAALDLLAVAESGAVAVYADDAARSNAAGLGAVATGRVVNRGRGGNGRGVSVVVRAAPTGRGRYWELSPAGLWTAPLDDAVGTTHGPRPLDRDILAIDSPAGRTAARILELSTAGTVGAYRETVNRYGELPA